MSTDPEITSDDNKATKRPLILCGLFVLVIYPLSVPFYYLIGQSLPVWMHDYYLPLSRLYDPLGWLYHNVEWVKESMIGTSSSFRGGNDHDQMALFTTWQPLLA